MNEELTREVLEAMKRCNHGCPACSADEFCTKRDLKDIMQTLATALLEEMDKPKVWDGAPEESVRCITNWFGENGAWINSTSHTRESPKTRARQIAEEIAAALDASPRYKTEIEIIESALNKYAEELEGKK